MSIMPVMTNPYLESFTVGLLYGVAFCTSACLPYLVSYIAGIGAGFRKGVIITLIYNSGRLAAYALIGGLVGVFSNAMRLFVSESTMSPFQEYSSYAFCIVTIAIGASILIKSRTPSCNCSFGNKKETKIRKYERFDVRAFSLGLTRGLVICPPLMLLMLYSVTFAAPIDTFIVTVLFGLGTALSPLLFMGGVVGWLFNKAPLFKRWISIVGAYVLILLGAGTLINTIIVAYS